MKFTEESYLKYGLYADFFFWNLKLTTVMTAEIQQKTAQNRGVVGHLVSQIFFPCRVFGDTLST